MADDQPLPSLDPALGLELPSKVTILTMLEAYPIVIDRWGLRWDSWDGGYVEYSALLVELMFQFTSFPYLSPLLILSWVMVGSRWVLIDELR